MTHQATVSRLGSLPAHGRVSRLPSLTGARFIAAVLVFLFHSMAVYPLVSPGAHQTQTSLFSQAGFTGVTFFFVLSGFVLTWAMRPKDTAAKFWRRRFFKIYPIHLLTFTAMTTLLALAGPVPRAMITKTTFTGGNALLNLLLLQSWSPDLAVRTSFNVVAWSLSCEALFYLAFPLVIKLVNKVPNERLWFATIISGASVISLPAFVARVQGGVEFPGQGYTDRQLWVAFHFPPLQLLTFVFGIFLAKIVLTGQRLPLKLGGAIALSVGAYFVTPLFGPLYRFSAVMVIPLGLLVAAAAAADVDRLPTFLGSKVMVWFGEISFAFFMWHFIVLSYGHQFLGNGDDWNTPTAISVTVLLFAVAVALSWATFTFVERPIMRRFATSRRA